MTQNMMLACKALTVEKSFLDTDAIAARLYHLFGSSRYLQEHPYTIMASMASIIDPERCREIFQEWSRLVLEDASERPEYLRNISKVLTVFFEYVRSNNEVRGPEELLAAWQVFHYHKDNYFGFRNHLKSFNGRLTIAVSSSVSARFFSEDFADCEESSSVLGREKGYPSLADYDSSTDEEKKIVESSSLEGYYDNLLFGLNLYPSLISRQVRDDVSCHFETEKSSFEEEPIRNYSFSSTGKIESSTPYESKYKTEFEKSTTQSTCPILLASTWHSSGVKQVMARAVRSSGHEAFYQSLLREKSERSVTVDLSRENGNVYEKISSFSVENNPRDVAGRVISKSCSQQRRGRTGRNSYLKRIVPFTSETKEEEPEVNFLFEDRSSAPRVTYEAWINFLPKDISLRDATPEQIASAKELQTRRSSPRPELAEPSSRFCVTPEPKEGEDLSTCSFKRCTGGDRMFADDDPSLLLAAHRMAKAELSGEKKIHLRSPSSKFRHEAEDESDLDILTPSSSYLLGGISRPSEMSSMQNVSLGWKEGKVISSLSQRSHTSSYLLQREEPSSKEEDDSEVSDTFLKELEFCLAAKEASIKAKRDTSPKELLFQKDFCKIGTGKTFSAMLAADQLRSQNKTAILTTKKRPFSKEKKLD